MSSLRIGELSRRSGVTPELLRAWERRYGLLHPERSPGGLRLYSSADLERVRRMLEHMAQGLAAREAAALALREGDRPAAAFDPQSARAALANAMDAFDEPRAQAVVDTLLATTTVDALLTEAVLPYLRDLGQRWERGEASVAQEHFASTILRGRLLGLARGWGRGLGPLALLACIPHERHDLGLIAFGLALRARGWRIAYLGADTPLETIDGAARLLAPAVVVLGAATEDGVGAVASELRELAKLHRLALGGSGFTGDTATELGAMALAGDPVSAAEQLTACHGTAGR